MLGKDYSRLADGRKSSLVQSSAKINRFTSNPPDVHLLWGYTKDWARSRTNLGIAAIQYYEIDSFRNWNLIIFGGWYKLQLLQWCQFAVVQSPQTLH